VAREMRERYAPAEQWWSAQASEEGPGNSLPEELLEDFRHLTATATATADE